MVINWIDVILAALLLFALLKAEQAYRIWRWKRSRKPQAQASANDYTVGYVKGAALAAPCGQCGVLTKNFFTYADGDQWCERCHQEFD